MNRMNIFRMMLPAGLIFFLVSACDKKSSGCSGCTIDEVCIPRGAVSFDNPCLICEPIVSRTSYSTLPNGTSCDDGIDCSVGTTCQAGLCRGRSSCETGLYCDPELKACVLNCPQCSIDGWCYYANQKNPQNVCQHCNVLADRYAWSNNDGEPCDDGIFCNGEDRCLGGTCSQHLNAPCEDDGVECNGEEICDEVNRECFHTNDFCGPDEVCHEGTDRCCFPMQSVTCGSGGNLVWVDSCGNRGVEFRECPFGCQGNLCVCPEGLSGDACDRCVVYVNGATGDDSLDGRSWAQAKATLQDGINVANVQGCEVWVAAGTYTPSGDREASFAVYANNVLYGGFAGTELSPKLRNIAAFPTIIEGEIGDPSLIDDNVCTLLVVHGTQVVIDGFTIQNGNRVGCEFSTERSAGGISFFGSFSSTLTLRNLILRGHHATEDYWMQDWYAAALHTRRASVFIDNCIFENNTGGAVHVGYGSLMMRKSIFRNNETMFKSALHIIESTEDSRIDNIRFLENVSNHVNPALARAAALNHESSDKRRLIINNSVFAGNSGYCVGAISTDSPLVLSSSTVAGNRATVADVDLSGFSRCTGGVRGPMSTHPMVMLHTIFWGNSVATPGFGKTRAQFRVTDIEPKYPLMRLGVMEYSEVACVLPGQIGDGQMDCPLGDDEMARGFDYQSCEPGHFQCWPWGDPRTHCIPAVQVCDGVSQCDNGRDEASCAACGAGFFQCRLPGDSWIANLYANPRLVNWDSTLGPLDLRLMPASNCIDAGIGEYLLLDFLDLDDDGDTSEQVPVDIAGNPRISSGRLDIGAYERQQEQ